MRKLILSATIAAAFFAGTFFTAFSIADATNGDNAWAKLVARVTALEENPANNMIVKKLHDDAEGNALGWNPDGDSSHTIFIISDSDVTTDSMVLATIDNNDPGSTPHPFCPVLVFDGQMALDCQFGVTGDGADVNYLIINPS